MTDIPDRSGLRAFFMAGQRLEVARKQTIIRLNEDSASVYWITQGFVKAFSSLSDGAEMCLHVYHADEAFPVMNVLGVQTIQISGTVDLTAYTDCVIYRRQRRELLGYLDNHPRDTLLLVEQQTQIYNPMISLHLASAEQKVVYHLLFLARRFGEPEDGYMRIELPFTQQELADSINVSRETTGKVLGRLEADGYVMRGRRFTLVHMRRLERLRQDIS